MWNSNRRRRTAGRLAMAGIASMAAAAAAEGATTIYVDDDAPAGGDGSSWATAYVHLQDALADAAGLSQGDMEIRIAQGVYRPDRDMLHPQGTGARDASFFLLDDVTVLGGFAGIGAADPDARDPEVYETILSGDLLGDDGPDFANNDENSYSVVSAVDVDDSAVLDGVTITAGNADGPTEDSPFPWFRGGGMYIYGAMPAIRSSTFTLNTAVVGGAVLITWAAPVFSNCAFICNTAETTGGIYASQGTAPSFAHCLFEANVSNNGASALYARLAVTVDVADSIFRQNTTEDGAGALRLRDVETIEVANCLIEDNYAANAGGLHVSAETAVIRSCVIRDNEAFAVGGLFISALDLLVHDCTIVGNSAEVIGGIVVGSAAFGPDALARVINTRIVGNESNNLGGGVLGVETMLVNCVIANNAAGAGDGGLCANAPTTAVNCTIASNIGYGINSGSNAPLTLHNCIIWGNDPAALSETSPNWSVSHCNIEGGWPGPGMGNIDADPLFVQPGLGNFALASGSPCLDAGLNALLPPDTFDLDGDGDTREVLPLDVAGNPRVDGVAVDMGAYEGDFAPLPPADGVEDLGAGEFALLLPGGGGFAPFDDPAAFVTNTSETDEAQVIVTDWSGDVAPGAEDALLLEVTTTLPAGGFSAIMYLPFDETDLNGHDPLSLNLTVFDEASEDWLLAPALNTVNSPGWDEPIGNRFAVESDEPVTPSMELGDYGVVWNPQTGQGYVWANVDHAGAMSQRIGACPTDCAPPGGNNIVGVTDLLALLEAWDSDNRWCDVDDDGLIDAIDLATLLESWGGCP